MFCIVGEIVYLMYGRFWFSVFLLLLLLVIIFGNFYMFCVWWISIFKWFMFCGRYVFVMFIVFVCLCDVWYVLVWCFIFKFCLIIVRKIRIMCGGKNWLILIFIEIDIDEILIYFWY